MSPREEWIFGDANDVAVKRAPARPQRERVPATRQRQRKVRRGFFGRFVLFVLWLLCFVAGTACLLVFATGLLRDGTFTDSQIGIDLSRRNARQTQFRPWVPGQYSIYLTTDDRQDRAAEQPFNGRIYVRVQSPDGRLPLSERYEPPALDHRLRGGVEFTRLSQVNINTPTLDPWTLYVRVAAPDEAFADAQSSVVIRREKRVTGLNGLINYLAAGPALVFLALSVPAALGLPRRGGTWMPALLSVLGLTAVAGLVLAV